MSNENPHYKLTAKQIAFIEEYVKDWNASAAARRAGYSQKTAAYQACKMLKKANIQAAIKKHSAKEAENAGLTVERILKKLEEIIFTDYRATVSDELRAVELTGRYLGMWDGSGGKGSSERDRKTNAQSILDAIRKLAG